MKTNKKGFTLVELLGVIVIMGILLVLGLPAIVGMIDSNRKKIYVTDAERLITKAEYKVKASTSEIEKPDPGDCIVISLMYLDDESFDNPPYEGEYEKDASFVVAKNTGNGNLEYSVMIVEHTKDGYYQGIELTKENVLKRKSAASQVVTFKPEELDEYRIKDETDAPGEYQINEMLKKTSNSEDNYVGSVYSYYIYPKMPEEIAGNDAVKPSIERASAFPTVDKGYKSLDVTLSLTVKDLDSKKDQLTVYIAIGNYKNSNEGYEEALKHSYPHPDSNSFNQSFDLSIEEANHKQYTYTGETIKFYVVVKDEKGNEDRKNVDYTIHKNKAPTFVDGSGFSTRPINTENATLTLMVQDDMDDTENLQICYTENQEATDCNNYQSYSSVINSESKMDYTFQCSGNNGCSLDGSTVYLKVFVKDSDGLVATNVFPYTLYANQKPTLQDLDDNDDTLTYINIISNGNSLPEEGSLTTLVDIRPVDDTTESNQIKIILNEIKNGAVVKSSGVVNYNGAPISFTFDGDANSYNGEVRTLQVILEDKDGLKSDINDSIYYQNYTIYANEAPSITAADVNSDGVVCDDDELCPAELGGAKTVIISADVEDDIDNKNDIKFCVSENQNSCTNANNFTTTYSKISYDSESPLSITLNQDYAPTSDGSDKYIPIYIAAMDSSGTISQITQVDYLLYQNQAPVVTENPYFINEEETINIQRIIIDDSGSVTSVEEQMVLDQMIGKFKYRFSVADDFDQSSNLKVKVCYQEQGTSNSTCLPEKNYAASDDTDNFYEESIDLNLTNYNGQIYEVYAIVRDSYDSERIIDSIDYTVYSDIIPDVQYIIGNYNTGSEHTVNVRFAVADPYDTYQICINNSDNPEQCTNYVGNGTNGDFDGTHYENYNINYTGEFTLNSDSNDTQLYMFVKDSHGNISDATYFNYSDYEPCSELNEEVTKEEYYIDPLENDKYRYNNNPVPDNQPISASRCSGKCYYWNSITQVLANKLGLSSTGPSDTDGIFGYYAKRITYQDKKDPNLFCLKNEAIPETIETTKLGCNYYNDCLYQPGSIQTGIDDNNNPIMSDKDPYRNRAIGLVIRTSDEPITGTYQDGTETVPYTCTEYYQGYETEYDSVTETFHLNETEYKYCKNLVDNGIYPFITDSPDAYFRVLDSDD